MKRIMMVLFLLPMAGSGQSIDITELHRLIGKPYERLQEVFPDLEVDLPADQLQTNFYADEAGCSLDISIEIDSNLVIGYELSASSHHQEDAAQLAEDFIYALTGWKSLYRMIRWTGSDQFEVTVRTHRKVREPTWAEDDEGWEPLILGFE